MDAIKGAGRLLLSAARAGIGIVFSKYLLIAATIGLVFALVAVVLIVPTISSDQTRLQAGGDQCTPTGTIGAVPDAPAAQLEEQIANAKTIDQVAQKLGLSGQASKVTIIAAIGESDLLNLDHGDNAGPDSAGILQQRPSQGWGTRDQVRTPAYAAESFLIGQKHDRKGGLVAVNGWERLAPTLAIHEVQRNSDALHYASSYSRADSIIDKANIDVDRPGSASSSASAAADDTATALCGSVAGSISQAKSDYPYDDVTPPPGVYETDPFGYYYGECTSFVAWRINRDAGSTKAPYKYSASKGNFLNGNGADWRAAWEKRGWKVSRTPVAGAVAWWGANGGEGVGAAGHVAYVQSVAADGKVIIEEYNNSYYAPPGHKYSKRPQPVDPSTVNAFLYPPGK